MFIASKLKKVKGRGEEGGREIKVKWFAMTKALAYNSAGLITAVGRFGVTCSWSFSEAKSGIF